jgi:hypothetical protein
MVRYFCTTQAVDTLHRINWGDLPTWLAAIGTVGALWLATWQYVRNSRRRHQQLIRNQADNVTAWVVTNNGRFAWLAVQNQSKNPIYEVIVTLVPFQGSGDPSGKTTPMEFRGFISVVPPGISYVNTAGHSGMSFHPAANVVFTDGNANNWVREGNGSLNKIGLKPMEYYAIPRPIGWQLPIHDLPDDAKAQIQGKQRKS